MQRGYVGSPLTVFLVTTFLIFKGLKSRWLLQNGDAAGFVDAMTDQSGTGDINFTYRLSAKTLRRLFTNDSSQVGASQFLNPDNLTSFIHWHPYLFGYIPRIVPIKIFDIENLPLALLAASYALGITMIYGYLQKRDVPIMFRLVYTFLVASSPILIEAINGQPYFDKLFFGPCVAILLLFFSEKRLSQASFYKISILLILSMSLSERATLFASTIMIAAVVLKHGKDTFQERRNVVLLAISVLGITWYLVWQKYISQNSYIGNSDVSNYLTNVSNLFKPDRQPLFQTFTLTLLPFLVIIFMRFSFSIIAIIAILPNLLVTIGGAELTGYTTHYHSMYLPVILTLSALAIGTAKDNSSMNAPKSKYVISLTVLSFTLGLMANFNYTNRIYPERSVFERSLAYGKTLADSFGLIPNEVSAQRSIAGNSFLGAVTSLQGHTKESISAPENFMPALTRIGFGSIDYFPIGLGNSDFVVVPFTTDEFNFVEISIYGLVPAENRELWSRTILTSLNESYREISRGSGSYGNVIVYRKKI